MVLAKILVIDSLFAEADHLKSYGMSSIASILAVGSCLIVSEGGQSHHDLSSALKTRLEQYCTKKGIPLYLPNPCSLDDLQIATAKCALDSVEQAHKIYDEGLDSGTVGTRDLSQLRTLLSIAFRWGLELPLSRWISSSGKSTPDTSHPTRDYNSAMSTVSHVVAMHFPSSAEGGLSQSPIISTILDRHLAQLLRGCIILGWDSESSEVNSQVVADVRKFIDRILATSVHIFLVIYSAHHE
jgi:hypothetical protein